jgi:hypothetical protein
MNRRSQALCPTAVNQGPTLYFYTLGFPRKRGAGGSNQSVSKHYKWGGVVAELFDKLFEVYSIQPCVIKFVSDLRQVYGFRGLLWILRCPLSIKLTIAITEILMKVVLNRHNLIL